MRSLNNPVRFWTLLAIILGIAGLNLSIAAPQKPKNIILMIGDGCGFNHLQAANYWRTGKDSAAYSTFPIRGAISTWSQNRMEYLPEAVAQDFTYVMRGYTDSGASGTAFSTGKKTYNGMISTDVYGNPLNTATQWAHANGKRAGVAGSVHFANATPATMAAHQPSRSTYADIANEMLTSTPLSVIVTPSHPEYTDDGVQQTDSTLMDFALVGGVDTWKRLRNKTLRSNPLKEYWTLIDHTSALDSIARGLRNVPFPLIGIPKVRTTLQQRRSTVEPNAGLPNLATLSLVALNTLNQDPAGFFLMIEGGAIDWASHNNESDRLLEETSDFITAIDSVVAWIGRNGGWDSTLLVITADHETGYLTGPDILLNQPWSRNEQGQVVLSPIENRGAGVAPGMRWNSLQHTNQLVPLFANGPGAQEIFRDRLGVDFVRGPYSDNALVGLRIKTLWAIPDPNDGWVLSKLIPAPATTEPASQ